MDFKNLKRNSSVSFDKLVKNMEDMSSTKKKGDERFWWPTVDKEGNGSAIIRFIPTKNEEIPFIRMFDHGFKGPSGSWYIEKSLTTIGQEDPMSQFNSFLWNSTSDDESPLRKQVRNQKRQLKFISNIYVIKDPGNPENEGKVFLYAYGKKIWDKLNAVMHPEFEDEKGFNPFDLWEGANFRVRIAKVAGFRNYDRSEFDRPAPLKSDDQMLEGIYDSTHSLLELLDEKHFKTYPQLDKELRRVLGNQYISWAAGQTSGNLPPTSASPAAASEPKQTSAVETKPTESEEMPWDAGTTVTKDGQEPDVMSYYESLASGG
jgi:hypothetical protein